MKDRSDDPSHHDRTHLPRSYISLPLGTLRHPLTAMSEMRSDANDTAENSLSLHETVDSRGVFMEQSATSVFPGTCSFSKESQYSCYCLKLGAGGHMHECVMEK